MGSLTFLDCRLVSVSARQAAARNLHVLLQHCCSDPHLRRALFSLVDGQTARISHRPFTGTPARKPSQGRRGAGSAPCCSRGGGRQELRARRSRGRMRSIVSVPAGHDGPVEKSTTGEGTEPAPSILRSHCTPPRGECPRSPARPAPTGEPLARRPSARRRGRGRRHDGSSSSRRG